MEKEIEMVLEKNEKILWSGKPDLKAAVLKSFLGVIIILIIAGFFYFSTSNPTTCTINGQERPPEDCASFISPIAIILFILALLTPIFAYFYAKITTYVVSNKRLLIKSGFIGADIRSIYYDQIRSVFVNVDLFGKLLNTGTILIDTGRITQTDKGSKTVYDRFENIKNPYDVYRIIQSVLSDRKEGLHSGRADFESNKEDYKKYVQETERMRRNV